jgi:hypothetical protein
MKTVKTITTVSGHKGTLVSNRPPTRDDLAWAVKMIDLIGVTFGAKEKT